MHDLAVGSIEIDLVIEMVNAKWRQRRLCLIESCMFETKMEGLEKAGQTKNPHDEILAQTRAFNILSDAGRLAFLNRMASRTERDYSRALGNLLHLQRLRRTETPAPPAPNGEEKKVKNEPDPKSEHRSTPPYLQLPSPQPQVPSPESPTPPDY